MLRKQVTMPKHLKSNKKEITEQFVISFFFTAFIYLIIHLLFSEQIYTYLNIINMITIEQVDVTYPSVSFDKVTKKLNDYPLWGNEFGTIEIKSIDLKMPIYQGDTLDILKYGIGHFSGSFFPGEGGSIIFAGHNNKGFLYHLPEVKINDEIIVKTTYGTFTYKVFDEKIIKAKDNDAFTFTKEKEILMIYTCYPVNTVGHKTKRFLVYAEKVGETYEK